MKAKHLLLIGIVYTSLVTAVVLSELVQSWVSGLLLLITGLAGSYYLALSHRRIMDLEDMQRLLRNLKRIAALKSRQDILDKIVVLAPQMVDCERCFAVVREPEWDPENRYAYPPDWQEARELCRSVSGIAIEQEGCDYPNSPVMTVPIAEGKILLFLIREKKAPSFNDNDIKHMTYFAEITSAWLDALYAGEQMESYWQQVLSSSVRALEELNPQFIGHAYRVAGIARLLGDKLGLDNEERRQLLAAAWLHDIGRRSDSEGSDEAHPQAGVNCLPDTDEFEPVQDAILYHHERYNGTGFPEGLDHTDIPWLARIIAVADFFDALTALSIPEEALDYQTALQVMRKSSGSLFDPLVIEALGEVIGELETFLSVKLAEDEDVVKEI
ncbi:MAG: HD domain-containing protein [Syntrophomonadaceae bacterium]|nr:HD domain-containing protein [Syntrophomonadaceae bacterium]